MDLDRADHVAAAGIEDPQARAGASEPSESLLDLLLGKVPVDVDRARIAHQADEAPITIRPGQLPELLDGGVIAGRNSRGGAMGADVRFGNDPGRRERHPGMGRVLLVEVAVGRLLLPYHIRGRRSRRHRGGTRVERLVALFPGARNFAVPYGGIRRRVGFTADPAWRARGRRCLVGHLRSAGLPGSEPNIKAFRGKQDARAERSSQQ